MTANCRTAIVCLITAFVALTAAGQSAPAGTVTGPPTDSSHQASPASSAPQAGASSTTDGSAEASPLPEQAAPKGHHVRPGDKLVVTLDAGVSSASAHNGQVLQGHLVNALAAQGSRASLPAGAPVTLTVVATVAAGKITSYGELTLQATQVGSVPLFTLPVTYRGKRGAKDLPDSAPGKGEEAKLSTGTKLTFVVQPPPQPASGNPGGTHIGVPLPVPKA